MPERDVRLTYRDPLQILKLAQFKLGKRVGDNQLVECPFHGGDANPSCSVELVKGVFHCHGCQRDGRFEELVAQKMVGDSGKVAVEGVRRIYKEFLEEINVKTIDPDRVEVWHRRLVSDDCLAEMASLTEAKGLTTATIEQFGIGWNGERYTLPVYDQHRNIVNVRYRTLDPDAQQKCKNHPGHGSPARLYPFNSLEGPDDEWVIVTEGETKALLLRQMGFLGVTGTAGVGKWNAEWNVWFKGKRVALMCDIDDGGIAGAQTIARNLLGSAAEVRVCRIPLDRESHPKGSVEDWINEFDVTKQQIKDLIESTPAYAFTLSEVGQQIDTTLPINPLQSLDEVSNPEWHDKHIQVDAVIAAEETELYRVPIAWTVTCQENQICCSDCPVKQLKQRDWKAEPWCNTGLLKLIDVPEHVLHFELRKRTGIPRMCTENEIRATELINVQAIEMIPDLDRKTRDRDTVLAAFFAQRDTGDRRELHGSLHTVKGFPTADPKSGRLVLLAYDAKPAKESLDRFVVDEALNARLKVFQPEAWTVDGIESKLNALYTDLVANVTHIYGRQDMHLVYDLCYHSVLSIPFNSRNLKGWVEGLVVGDTGQGKSAAFEALRDYYGVGDMAVGANCTAAGLLGSVQESARKKRWVYRWGKIPLNDRRLVCIEEAGGMPYELIQRIRDSRSSGRHEDTKAKLTRVSTRTRLVWIANPRGNRALHEYAYGIVAMKELIGDNADIRRFDVACFILGGEVDLAHMRNGATKIPHVHKQDLCQALILWAWSRLPDQIVFDQDAVVACRTAALEMSKRFTDRFPLVLGTEHDEKIARLAAALAARTFSTVDDDAEVLRVRKCHVEAVAKFLDHLYSAPSCNYHLYSQRIREEDSVADNGELAAELKKLLTARSTAEFLLETASFSSRDLAYVSGRTFGDAEQLIGLMLRVRGVKPNPKQSQSYVKTSGFIELLKRIVDSDDLKDQTAEDKFKDVKF